MRAHPPHALEVWPGDAGPVTLPSGTKVASLYPDLHQRATDDLQWIAETVQTIKQQDDDDLFEPGGEVASDVGVEGEGQLELEEADPGRCDLVVVAEHQPALDLPAHTFQRGCSQQRDAGGMQPRR